MTKPASELLNLKNQPYITNNGVDRFPIVLQSVPRSDSEPIVAYVINPKTSKKELVQFPQTALKTAVLRRYACGTHSVEYPDEGVEETVRRKVCPS